MAPSPKTTVSSPFSLLSSSRLKCTHNSGMFKSNFANMRSLVVMLHFEHLDKTSDKVLQPIITVAPRNDNLGRSASTALSAIFVFQERIQGRNASLWKNICNVKYNVYYIHLSKLRLLVNMRLYYWRREFEKNEWSSDFPTIFCERHF